MQALAFDSFFDTYKGVVTHVRVFNGELKPGMNVKLLHSGKSYEVKEVGSFNPKPYARAKLELGETGYMTANIKTAAEVKMGDTITDSRHPSGVLPGFKEVHPMVFSGIYPINTADYEHLKVNMGKLQLNDSAFVYQAETSVALGFGFRCGFLGLLHMEIVQERLRREYGMDIIATYPSVVYRVTLTDGTVKVIDNPAYLLEVTYIERVETAPREMRMHIVVVDLKAPEIRFKVTAPGGSMETVRQTTLEFLRQEHAQVAVNAHYFLPFPSASAESNLVGFAASAQASLPTIMYRSFK